MKVKLLHYTPLDIANTAIGKCWDKDTDKPEARMYRVANKFKHSSTIEHITYNFDIDGISRACLQELARHRMQNMSVKSSRYTLGELKSEHRFARIGDYDLKDTLYKDWKRADKYLVYTDDKDIDLMSLTALENLRRIVCSGKSNDIAKYCMPEAYKTSLISTMNMRALQNFLSLRTDKSAMWEIQELAHAMFEVIPDDHKFMLVDYVKTYGEDNES